MEDNSWESWTTPLPGHDLGYPEGRKLPSGPAPGWIGELRSSTRATADSVRYAERIWPQGKVGDFERTGKRRFTDRATGTEYALVHGDPLLGDDPEVADCSSSRTTRSCFAPRRPAGGAEQVHGDDGRDEGRPLMNRDMRTSIETFGPDWREWPSDCWGRRDWQLADNPPLQ